VRKQEKRLIKFISRTKKLYFPNLLSKVCFLLGLLVRNNEWAIRESEELSSYLDSLLLIKSDNTILTKPMFRRFVDRLVKISSDMDDTDRTMLEYVVKALLLADTDYHFLKVETGYFLMGFFIGREEFLRFLARLNREISDDELERFESEQEKSLRRFITTKRNLYPEGGSYDNGYQKH